MLVTLKNIMQGTLFVFTHAHWTCKYYETINIVKFCSNTVYIILNLISLLLIILLLFFFIQACFKTQTHVRITTHELFLLHYYYYYVDHCKWDTTIKSVNNITHAVLNLQNGKVNIVVSCDE